MRKPNYIDEINTPSNTELHLFAAANTYDGFVSFFGEIFATDATRKTYILKGGPGIGKSTLMKKFAEKAKNLGYTPIFYHCSSDPKSLDGVFVPETGTAMLDGTSPHVFEPIYPGVRDVYVNLAEAWDTAKLSESADTVKRLCDAKSRCYATAYRLLSATKSVEAEAAAAAFSFINHKKIADTAKRFTAKYLKKALSEKNGVKTANAVTSAVSANGRVRFFSYENTAETRFFVKKSKLAERFFFSELAKCVENAECGAVISRSPESPSVADGIYLPSGKISVSLADEEYLARLDRAGKPYKIINASRFILSDGYKACKEKLRFAERCADTLKNEAYAVLSAAGIYHARAERLYAEATDYSLIEQIGNRILADAF